MKRMKETRQNYQRPEVRLVELDSVLPLANSMRSEQTGIGWGGNTSESETPHSVDVKATTVDWDEVW